MKKTLLMLVVVFCLTPTFAQSYYGRGDSKLNVGYDIYGYGQGIQATLDFGLNDMFSIGFGGSYYFDEDCDYFLFGRTAFHFGEILDLSSNFDFYPGLAIGYLGRNDIGFNAFIGARYFFTKNLGVFAEVGNNGSAGLSWCF